VHTVCAYQVADCEWDEPKRQWTLRHRKIDFIALIDVFDDPARVILPPGGAPTANGAGSSPVRWATASTT